MTGLLLLLPIPCCRLHKESVSKKPASQVQITFSGTSEIEWENGNGFLKVVTGHCLFPSGIWSHQILGEKIGQIQEWSKKLYFFFQIVLSTKS